ncbi:MAG TPA: hypothetical protein VHS58_13950 [Acetobacteraceae bacterium]|nr:hypothetical protein [Acetobacteraceae bacterium]
MQPKRCVGAAISALFALAPLTAPRAQTASVPAPAPAPVAVPASTVAVEPPPLTVNLYPYLWLPTIRTTVNYPIRGGGTATTTLRTTPGDYIPKLNFGAMLAGDVEYQRFSLLSDIMYLNVGATGERVRTFNLGLVPTDASKFVQATQGTRLGTTIWTLAGGYKVAEGDWGAVEAFAGVRLVSLDDKTNLSLGVGLSRPDGSVVFGRSAGLTVNKTIADGIGGVRGRVFVGSVDAFGGGRFFVPFYLDAGEGANFTWQGFTGLGYQTKTFGVSVGYRYLSFRGGGDATIPKLNLGGPIITGNFTF